MLGLLLVGSDGMYQARTGYAEGPGLLPKQYQQEAHGRSEGKAHELRSLAQWIDMSP